MVFKLSHDEVLTVCSYCNKFVEALEACQIDYTTPPKPLREVRKCKKWDEYYGDFCIYTGKNGY